MKKTLLFGLVLIINGWGNIKANNVQVSNVALSSTGVVSFDVSWENSWRTNTTLTTPNNHDGVWVFIKWRYCIDRPASQGGATASVSGFRHAFIDTVAAKHTVPAGAGLEIGKSFTQLTPTPSNRGMGVFIYRNAGNMGIGNVNFTNVALQWDTTGVSPSSGVDIKVFAIEMVYIPQGSFYVGDGRANNQASMLSAQSTATPPNVPFQVTSEAPIPIATPGGLYVNSALGNTSTTPVGANFPKGFDAFWIMKYEVSQNQYVDYLNCLSRNEQDARTQSNLIQTSTNRPIKFINNINTITNRFVIKAPATFPAFEPIIFGVDANDNEVFNEASDGGYSAVGFINAEDILFYIDWVGLRPMSEMEYEKAARGPLVPIPFEYAWGNTTITPQVGFTNPFQANELTIPSGDGPCVVDDWVSSPTIGLTRVGARQFPLATRVQAGASYYGVADLSGNVSEFVMPLLTNARANFSRFVHGDGEIITPHNAIPSLNWLSFSTSFNSRGGHFTSVYNPSIPGYINATISNQNSGASTSRQWGTGIRAVRTSLP
ncbi:MAG: SUMF1/EgtB/PvdO family nonheme iron enzyme [Vicingaceae bacterium]|nr:SUMF1/EgtB/PvdO family nonheme iron enzyme [Vicingaceae bacterium]